MGILKAFKEDDDWCVRNMGFLKAFKEYVDCGKEHEVPFFPEYGDRAQEMS